MLSSEKGLSKIEGILRAQKTKRKRKEELQVTRKVLGLKSLMNQCQTFRNHSLTYQSVQ